MTAGYISERGWGYPAPLFDNNKRKMAGVPMWRKGLKGKRSRSYRNKAYEAFKALYEYWEN